MNDQKIKEGRVGEGIATEFLRKKGYRIVERNFRGRNGEIDIIAIDSSGSRNEKTLVFVEVKTRSSGEFGTPLEAINYWKLKSLTRVAQYYKLTHPKLPDLLRIDAVSIKISSDGKLMAIEHIKNITG